MTVDELTKLIDDELASQNKVQNGTYYWPSDDSGVAAVSMNIVVPQLARKILKAMQ